MISVFHLFEVHSGNVVGVQKTRNYVVEKYEEPDKNVVTGYRRKTVIDKDGYRHVLTFAILKKDPTRPTKNTQLVSIGHHKTELSDESQHTVPEGPK